MRKITEEASRAFHGGYNYSKSNTRVEHLIQPHMTSTHLYLHGHEIARRTNEGTFISNQGYSTNVTKERLNGVLWGRRGIHQKDFIWYYTNEAGNVEEFPCDEWFKVV